MPRSSASPSPVDPRQPARLRDSWQRRSSPLARYALLVYVAIVVDASLFPFSGWRDLGLAPYAYLSADWPRHALPFDLVVNAIGYLPLGFVCGLALHPRLRGIAMVLVATAFCALLAIHLEALQTYLPARVASKVDVATNVGGGLIGALFAARFAHTLLDTGRLRVWRTRWFVADASRGLVLVGVWFGALIYPDAFVFGMGAILKAFAPDHAAVLAATLGLADESDPGATAVRFQVAESLVAAGSLTGAGLLLMNLSRRGVRWSARAGLVALFIVTTVAVQTLSHAFLFDEAVGWPPLTPGARTGVAIAGVVLFVATLLPVRIRWMLAIAAATGSLVLVNVYPDNPYGNAVGLAWTRGKLLNFYGLASGLNLVWPYLAVVYLLRHRGTSSARGTGREPVAANGSAGGWPL